MTQQNEPACPTCGSRRKSYRKCVAHKLVHNASNLKENEGNPCVLCSDDWHRQSEAPIYSAGTPGTGWMPGEPHPDELEAPPEGEAVIDHGFAAHTLGVKCSLCDELKQREAIASPALSAEEFEQSEEWYGHVQTGHSDWHAFAEAYARHVTAGKDAEIERLREQIRDGEEFRNPSGRVRAALEQSKTPLEEK